jgi:hypothetical protein
MQEIDSISKEMFWFNSKVNERINNLKNILISQLNVTSRISLTQQASLVSNRKAEVQGKCRLWLHTDFLPQITAATNSPPLLLSFPGSGNTWVRLLIEAATGYFSGSIDLSDTELKKSFPGEDVCGLTVSCVKGHPSDFYLNDKGNS